MGIKLILSILLAIPVCFIITLIPRHFEKKNFNNGICPKCGKKLRNFDMDSEGGRGYICDECNYTTWCSYNVDKNYK